MSNEFLAKIEQSLDKLVTLNITTAIGTKEENRAIETEIDMLQGDISTLIHDDYITKPELKPTYDFHLEREKQAGAIVKGNIDALKSLIDLTKELTGSKN